MRINQLEVHNFKGINDLHLELNNKSTVIFGENGIGKSSILKAIAIAYSPILASKVLGTKNKPLSFQEPDISFGESVGKIGLTMTYEGHLIDYHKGIERKGKKTFEDKTNKSEIINMIKKRVEDENADVPVFINYGVHRAVFHIPLRIRNGHNTFEKLVAFENCLNPITDFKTFFEWYRNQEDIENELVRENNNYEDTALKSVQQAIYSFLPEVSQLRVRRKPKLQMVIVKNHKTLDIAQLSDGEKNLLALIGDIARRLAIANPLSSNPLKGNGIVLIDEIELHLHPRWQRNIIPNLQKVFPNIQFIITTHSPQVLGELNDINIFKLKREQEHIEVQKVNKLYGQDSNFILEEYMGTNKENKEIKNMIEDMYSALEEGSYEHAEELKNKLSNILGNNHSDIVKVEILLRRKKGRG